MSIGHIAINGRPLLPPLQNPQPSTDGPFRDGIFSPNSEPPFLLLVLIIALLFVGVVGSHTLCNPVRAQQPKSTAITPVPDSRFTVRRDVSPIVPISSCFADSLPTLKDGQILIQRHIYTAAIDTAAKQPAWIAFTVRRADWDTENKIDRRWHTPKLLQQFVLESADYPRGAYDMGHLYGLQLVLASPFAFEVNETTVIAAQRPDMNRGPWLAAENRVKLASETQTVSVMAGCLWRDEMPQLSAADEPHRIASHCFMMFFPGPDGCEESYVFPQSVARDAKLSDCAVATTWLKHEICERWTDHILLPESKP